MSKVANYLINSDNLGSYSQFLHYPSIPGDSYEDYKAMQWPHIYGRMTSAPLWGSNHAYSKSTAMALFLSLRDMGTGSNSGRRGWLNPPRGFWQYVPSMRRHTWLERAPLCASGHHNGALTLSTSSCLASTMELPGRMRTAENRRWRESGTQLVVRTSHFLNRKTVLRCCLGEMMAFPVWVCHPMQDFLWPAARSILKT